MIDLFGGEPQFVDHLAPVWHALPEDERGQFLVVRGLQDRALRRGVVADLQAVDPRRPVLVASYGDIKKARRLGRTRIAFIEHGIGQSYAGIPSSARHASYAGGNDRADVGLFLVPNETCAERWRGAYPGVRVEVVGCPKLDTLPRREGVSPRPVVAVSFHFESRVSPEARSAFPHYREALRSLTEEFEVIGHAHPLAYRRLSRQYVRMGIEPVEDFEDVCRRADVYVCDNSSTLYEFASTGRPVVVLNAPWYRRDVDHGLRFWEAANVGIQVNDPADLRLRVGRALAPTHLDVWWRERALDKVYAHRTDAAERAVAALLRWMRTSEQVAA